MAKQTQNIAPKRPTQNQPPAEYRIRKDCRSVFWFGGKPYRASDMIYADAELAAEYPAIIEKIEDAAAQSTESGTPDTKEQ